VRVLDRHVREAGREADRCGARPSDGAVEGRKEAASRVPAMGPIGDCYDNAAIESFWSRMQVELLDRERWKTRVELANAIFEYLEIFQNRQRRHSALGMLTPVEFEARQASSTAA
jgi:putative transposase